MSTPLAPAPAITASLVLSALSKSRTIQTELGSGLLKAKMPKKTRTVMKEAIVRKPRTAPMVYRVLLPLKYCIPGMLSLNLFI